MTRLLYDIETDGLLHEMTKVHCICTIDLDTRVMRMYYEQPFAVPELPSAGTIADGVAALNAAEVRAGHNIVNFDEIALGRYGLDDRLSKPGALLDTLVACRVLWPDEHLKQLDNINKRTGKGRLLNGALFGRQSLKAWGERLGVPKNDFGAQTEAWKTCTVEMLRYCAQDVRATETLYRMVSKQILAKRTSPRTLHTENVFARRIAQQMENGFRLNVPRLEKLVEHLVSRRAELTDKLTREIPPFVHTKTWVTEVKKIPKSKVVTTIFNPGSRPHVIKHLKERLGWKPLMFTPTGIPKLDDKVLDALDLPGIADFQEYFKVQKILGMAAEGKQAWLVKVGVKNKVKTGDGRLYGFVNHNGAVTGRCKHAEPNITQVPKIRTDKDGRVLWGYAGKYGADCRACFLPREGWTLVGVDASGLELRMLGHYMAPYDGGAYAKVVSEGDVHARNAKAIGKDRDTGKKFIYTWLYGGGAVKIAVSVGCTVAEAKRYKVEFPKNVPGLSDLMFAIKASVKSSGKQMSVRLPDGRRLWVRKDYAALNTLLQGTGALAMKIACNRFHAAMEAAGYHDGVHYAQVHQAHDELQIECPPELAEFVGKASVEAIREAGRELGLACPLDGQYKVGSNWQETH